MLARLDERLAPCRAAVNREGTLLRIEVQAGECDEPDVLAIVQETGYFAERTADSPRVDRWFGSGDVEELSAEEADVLATRWTNDLRAEGVVATSPHLTEVLRLILLDAMRASARSGVVAVARIEPDVFSSVFDEADRRRVTSWINAKLGHLAEEAKPDDV